MFASLLLLKSCSLSALQARLKVAAHQAEEESEDTAENFLEGRTDIDEFLTNFMEKRTVRSRTVSYLSNVTFECWSDSFGVASQLCHSRRAKEEKLQQSLNSQFPASH